MPLKNVASDDVVGTSLGGVWRIGEHSHADAFGAVFHGKREADGTAVLIRVVHEQLAAQPGFEDRLLKAANPALALSHPGILRLLAAGRAETGVRPFLYTVSEPFEGRSLCSIVLGRGLLPPGQSVLIGIQTLEALAQAHKAGVLHLDLRPESVVIGATADGVVRPKIADFAMGAAASATIARLALGGSTLGTWLYSAPERILGDKLDERADIYSMGAVLYEQLTGTAVFEGSSSLSVARMHLEQEPEPLRQRAPDRNIDPAVEEVILKALRKDRNERFSNALEMAAALVKTRGSGSTGSSLPPARRDSRLLPSTLHLSASGMVRRPFAVGREEPIEAVRSCALSPTEPQATGRAVILLGSAGLGKSAVLDEAVANLWGSPIAVVRIEGRCSLNVPLEPFTEAARDLLGIRRGAQAQNITPVEGFLRSRLELPEDDTTRLLDRISGRPSALAAGLEVVEREETASLRAFFGRVLATMPTLLVVEDAEALDSESSQLVLDLMQSTSSNALSVVVSARSEPWPEFKAPNVRRVELPPLDDASARIMLRDRMGAAADEALVGRTVGWARGCPLLLELRAQAAAGAEGSETKGEEAWSARALVDLCLHRASPPAREWLRCAAIAGVRSPIAMLEEWASPPRSSAELQRACAASGLVRVEGSFLAYRNQGVRDLVVELTSERDRLTIHRFIARWLAGGRPQRGTLEAIGAQFEQAGENEQAAEHFYRAGMDLMERDKPQTAAALFKRALYARQQAHDEAGAVTAGLAEVRALLAAGEGKRANEVIAQLERMGATDFPGLRARVLARVARAQGDCELATRILSRVTNGPQDGLDTLSAFEVQSDLSATLAESGRSSEAETHAAMAVQLAVRLLQQSAIRSDADTTRLSKAVATLARLRVEGGRVNEARTSLHQALELVAGKGDEASASRLLANLAWIASQHEDPKLAVEFAERALAYARKCGDRLAAARIALNLGAYQVRVGNTPAALLHLRLARHLARAMGWRKGSDIAREAMHELEG